MPTPFTCPHCGQFNMIPDGQEIRCPECGKTSAQASAAASGALMPPPPPPPPGQQPIPTASVFKEKSALVLNYGKTVSLSWWEQAQKAFAKHAGDIQISTAEKDKMMERAILDPAVQKHFVWRRSLLWFITVPATFIAIVKTISFFTDTPFDQMSAFGILIEVIRVLCVWGIPAATVLAARFWYLPRFSRRILLAGFLIAFPVIVITALFPLKWQFVIDASGSPVPIEVLQTGLAILGGFGVFFTVLPAILSLLPGAMRACIRIKVLFPESIVSGWLLATVTPIYALFLLTIFLMVNQVASNFLLILGAAVLVFAPVTYLIRMPLFVSPVWADEDRERIAWSQYTYLIFLGVSALLLFIYAVSGKIIDKSIVGSNPMHAVPNPGPNDPPFAGDALVGYGAFIWNIMKFVLDYVARSLFISAIAMDFFLLINVSVWQNSRAFYRTDRAAEYEGTLNELGSVLLRD